MKIVIFDDNYPDESNLPGDMFVHTRARNYVMSNNHVIVLRRGASVRRLSYEGVEIRDFVTSQQALGEVSAFAPDVAAVHFAEEPFISEISESLSCPLFVWVHGYEAQAWHRRIFSMTLRELAPYRLPAWHLRSRERLNKFAKLIDRSNAGAAVAFVFVSDWIRRTCESDTHRRVANYQIIPNPIDIDRFQPLSTEGKARNVLVIRSSQTKKYSPDVIANTIRLLIKRAGVATYQFRIFSDGALYEKYFAPLAELPGVEVQKGYLSQQEMIEQLKWAGVFLCPTRQDTQGVSMCEAMASGLVVATTPVTAIPEFAKPDYAILSRSAEQLARDIDAATADPAKIAKMGKAASEYVRQSLSAAPVCDRELLFMSTYNKP